MYFDLPLEQLKQYKPVREEPTDFDKFWAESIRETKEYPLNLKVEPVDFGLSILDTFDITYAGYGGQPIKAWFILPKTEKKSIPCVVQYIGYGGGRGFPQDWLIWPASGFATLVMDTRGQGSSFMNGDTPDIPDCGSSPHYPGFMTVGILDQKQYYYRRVFCDAVRAVEAARNLSQVDPQKIAVCGKSQGGGISLAVSGLVPDLAAVMADVPFLCNFKRAVSITDAFPYNEITHFCKINRDKEERVFKTLSYFDALNFVCCANAPALFSVGLMDLTCPPSTVFSAFNHYAGKKQIETYDFNDHEGGGSHHDIKRTLFLKEQVK